MAGHRSGGPHSAWRALMATPGSRRPGPGARLSRQTHASRPLSEEKSREGAGRTPAATIPRPASGASEPPRASEGGRPGTHLRLRPATLNANPRRHRPARHGRPAQSKHPGARPSSTVPVEAAFSLQRRELSISGSRTTELAAESLGAARTSARRGASVTGSRPPVPVTPGGHRGSAAVRLQPPLLIPAVASIALQFRRARAKAWWHIPAATP